MLSSIIQIREAEMTFLISGSIITAKRSLSSKGELFCRKRRVARQASYK